MIGSKYQLLKSRKALIAFGAIALIFAMLLWVDSDSGNMPRLSLYPNGKDFAFTVTDDPDGTRTENVKPIYELLTSLGLRTTIAVWVDDPVRLDGIPDVPGEIDQGDSCQNADYLKFVQSLQQKGFEISLHTASAGNDTRETTIHGYEKFKSYFGAYPKINIMHSKNLENVYWGKKVVDNAFMRFLIEISSKKAKFPFSGEIPGDPYFWGDILKAKTKYVRLWGSSDINTLKYNPSMPYHDPEKPYVNYWFSFSDGYDVEIFTELISDKNIARLKDERGSCIVYTHFSANFTEKDVNGYYQLNKSFKSQMEKLSQDKQGWFVPASVILDRLLLMKNVNIFSFNNGIVVINSNIENVDGVTLLSEPGSHFFDINGRRFEADNQGEVIIGDMNENEALSLFFEKDRAINKKRYLGYWESINLVFRRMLVFIKHRIIG